MNIRELARACGVSRTAASLALRGDPRISAYLRHKICETAKQAGYHVDPKLSAILTEVARNTGKPHAAPLAVISPWPHQREWEHNWILNQFHLGIVSRALERGYRVDDFWLGEPKMSEARMRGILKARSIEGVIVLNYVSAPARLRLDLHDFAAAVVGRALPEPRLPAVDHDHHQGLTLALAELEGRGYDRIGLAMLPLHQEQERTAHQWEAAYRLYSRTIPPDRRIPIFAATTVDKRRLVAWCRRHQPDAVLGLYPETLAIFEALGFSAPKSFGFAALLWRRTATDIAGIDIRAEAIGAAAVDLVVAQLQQHECGIPAVGRTLLLDGLWRNGTTVAQLR